MLGFVLWRQVLALIAASAVILMLFGVIYVLEVSQGGLVS